MEKPVYTMPANIPYYDCDAKGRIKLPAAIRAMQKIASEHLDKTGRTQQSMYNNHMVFLLNKTCIKVIKMPMGGEDVTVKTCASGLKGPRFMRDIGIYDSNGDICIAFLTVWILVDSQTRKIIRPRDFTFPLPMSDSFVDCYIKDEPFPKKEKLTPDYTSQAEVKYSHIDNNGHVNNSVYVEYITDMLPYELMINNEIDKLWINYQNEAVLGDIINIECFVKSNKYHFVGTKKDKASCFEALLYFKE